MQQSVNIILASGSPRRKEMLARMGLQFTIIKSEEEEVVTVTDPAKVVSDLSGQKAREVADDYYRSGYGCCREWKDTGKASR